MELPDTSVAVIEVGTNSTCYSIIIESDFVFEAIEVLQATITRADPPITIDAGSRTASIVITDSTDGKENKSLSIYPLYSMQNKNIITMQTLSSKIIVLNIY